MMRSQCYPQHARSVVHGAVALLLVMAAGCGSSTSAGDTDVVTRNRTPVVLEIVLGPADARPTTTLRAEARVQDLDGDPVHAEIRWLVDGVDIGVTDSAVLEPGHFSKGSQVVAEAQATDGLGLGPPSRSEPLTIGNTLPFVASVGIEPVILTVASEASCVAVGVVDIDGDLVSLAYRWEVDGVAVDGATGPTLGSLVSQSDLRCFVTAADGEESGLEVGSERAFVHNTAPTVSSAQIVPDAPSTDDVLSVEVFGWEDPDGDPPAYRHEWVVNDVPRSNSTTLDGGLLQAGDAVYVRVQPWDGLAVGDPVDTPTVTLQPGFPEVPEITLTPGTGQVAGVAPLVCTVSSPAVFTTHLTWLRDGVVQWTEPSVRSSAIAPGDQRPGETWTCSVVAEGALGTSEAAEASTTWSPLAEIWAGSAAKRVSADSEPVTVPAVGALWDEDGARIRAFRNEVVALQFFLRAPDDASVVADVWLTDLVHADGLDTIPYVLAGDDPTDWTGRPLSLFAVQYLDVVHSSDAARWLSPTTPDLPTRVGRLPGPLLPVVDDGVARPLTIDPANYQAVMVEIYVDATRTPGSYHGTLELDVDGVRSSIPLDLRVSDLTLPDENSLTIGLFFDPEAVALWHGEDLTDRYHRLAHRHRLTLFTPSTVDEALASSDRLDGSAYQADRGYLGPRAGVGDDLLVRSWPDLPASYDSPEAIADDAAAWMDLVDGYPDLDTFLSVAHAPSLDDLLVVEGVGAAVDAAPGLGAGLPVLVGSPPLLDLDGFVDWWMVSPSDYASAEATVVRDGGQRYTWWDGVRPWTGALLLDVGGADALMVGPAAFSTGTDTVLLWHANHWIHGDESPPGRSVLQDVWAEPITWTDGLQAANGAGVLIWPGEDLLHPEQDKGIAGPVGSIRLMGLRRAVQDHLLLTMARDDGEEATVAWWLDTIVPSVLDTRSDADPVGFETDVDVYEEMRNRLRDVLEVEDG